ncbi:unnamed protein product [Phytomonas sp. EM1]|nr:unnamed protein product [Phytomonas sp. EM1]|eukprot:CCW65749.1 unnamed protein product [Phytomonas sp. isolate EM1]
MAFPNCQTQASTTVALMKPFQWYVNWVRANPENASSLERLSRTGSLIFCNHSNLLSMEFFSALFKVHKFSNQTIMQTAYRRVTCSEVIIYLLQVIQEVECLFELTLRKYTSHTRAWDALAALQALKCLLNACVHRQLFLVPWMWASIKRSVKRVLGMVLRLPRRLLLKEAPGEGAGEAKKAKVASRSVMGSVLGPNATRLVIPRVISGRRRRADSASEQRGEESDSDDGGAEVPFTWIDIFGLVIDGFMLLRPLLLVCVARRCFLKGSPGDHVARLTQHQDPSKHANGLVEDSEKPDPDAADKAPGSKSADPEWIIRATMAATPFETLFPSWRWWAVFAFLDGFVLLAARFIRVNRVPVVYIHSTPENDGVERIRATSERSHHGNDSAVEEEGAESIEEVGNPPGARMDFVYDLPVVSRDSLRSQQALRNLAYNFLRDPFFTASIKEFIYRHFIKGFINRIPILGSLVAFQVSYYLAMQHHSFLYSVGQ